MAFTMRSLRVAPNSATMEEARARVFDFFKTACRSLPTVIDIYTLHDVVTISKLRSTISKQIRANSHIDNPKVVDLLLFKATEELNNVVEHAKQRHHLIGQYVVGSEGLVQPSDKRNEGSSEFLKQFYKTNYF